MLKEFIWLSVKFVCFIGVATLAIYAGSFLRIQKNKKVKEGM